MKDDRSFKEIHWIHWLFIFTYNSDVQTKLPRIGFFMLSIIDIHTSLSEGQRAEWTLWVILRNTYHIHCFALYNHFICFKWLFLVLILFYLRKITILVNSAPLQFSDLEITTHDLELVSRSSLYWFASSKYMYKVLF